MKYMAWVCSIDLEHVCDGGTNPKFWFEGRKCVTIGCPGTMTRLTDEEFDARIKRDRE